MYIHLTDFFVLGPRGDDSFPPSCLILKSHFLVVVVASFFLSRRGRGKKIFSGSGGDSGNGFLAHMNNNKTHLIFYSWDFHKSVEERRRRKKLRDKEMSSCTVWRTSIYLCGEYK
jgi:hypothetical protein